MPMDTYPVIFDRLIGINQLPICVGKDGALGFEMKEDRRTSEERLHVAFVRSGN